MENTTSNLSFSCSVTRDCGIDGSMVLCNGFETIWACDEHGSRIMDSAYVTLVDYAHTLTDKITTDETTT